MKKEDGNFEQCVYSYNRDPRYFTVRARGLIFVGPLKQETKISHADIHMSSTYE